MIKMRLVILMLILNLAVTVCMPGMQTNAAGEARPDLLVDAEDLLDETEEEIVRELLNEVSDRHNMDVVIVTAADFGGRTSTQYADDFFDYQGYGRGSNYDGILLLVSEGMREWAISTCGYGIYAFTDAGQSYMTDSFVYYLSDGDYYLGFMEFGVGLDMAIVLIKAVLLSLLAVFTLMPGVLMLMCPLIDKTKHKKLLPDVFIIGRFCDKTKKIIVPAFVLMLGGAFYLSSMCPYCYSYNDLRTSNMSERQIAYHKINEVFGTSNMVAILVPTGNYDAEATILRELEACEEVNSCMGLANTELMDGYVMTDALTPREFSEVLGLDYEIAQMLYSGYVMNDEKYGQLLSVDNVEIPLFDMFCFLKDTMDESGIVLDGDMAEVTEMLDMLDMAREQLQTEEYSRMVVYLNLPEEGEDTYAFLDKIHEIADKFYSKDVYVLGNSTSSRDLASSFVTDNTIITVLSIVFVIAVLLFTFRSVGLPILLIIVIQGSIWINFSFPTLMNQPLYFLGYLIVNAIQMGANIDYAIVISSHYREEREHLPVSEAIAVAVNKAFPTVMTSGTIMASTGLLIGSISTQPVTAIMGECIGRGTIISMFLVLFVLPGILIIGDKIIERTTFKMKGIEVGEREETGTMFVKGHVRGYVSGVIDAEVDGVLHGRVHAVIATGGTVDVAEHDPEAAEKAKAMFLKDAPDSPIAEENEEGAAGHE